MHKNTPHRLRPARWLGLACFSLWLAGCAGTGPSSGAPVLYPNAAYKSMGEAAAREHLNQCMALARQSGAQPGDGAAAQGAMRGAAVAGVTGAVGSLVFGRSHLDDVIRNGAKTAVVGAAAGGVDGAMRERPHSTYHQFVQRCASEKGLEVIGWN